MALPVVALGLRAVLGRILGRATAVKTLTRLTSAQKSYSSAIAAFKSNPNSSPNPKIRSNKERQEDAIALSKIFLNYLRESIKGAKYNHTAKSAFTKKIQRARGNATKPLWFTGELWEDRKRGDLLVEKYTKIEPILGGAVVGFKVNARYVTPSHAYEANKRGYFSRRSKSISVGRLLSILENGEMFPITKKYALWLRGWVEALYTKKEIADYRKNRKLNPKNKGYIILPKRPFWNRAVTNFKAKIQRKNVVIEKSGKYKLKIMVKN